MKNRMIKVWGVVLTLAILAGLLVASVPASAANLAWTPNAIPSTVNNFLLGQIETEWVMAVSDDGSTILAYDNVAGKLYKSVDGGVTFTTDKVGVGLTDGDTGGETPTPIPAELRSIAIAADNTTAVAINKDGDILYGSTNGGNNWSVITPPSLTGTITAVDVIAGPTIAIGTSAGEYAIYGVAGGPFSGGWSAVKTEWQNGDEHPDLESNVIIGLAFSPNYAADQTIVLVHNDGDTTYVSFAWADQPVGTAHADLELGKADASESAYIAFPTDFNSSNGSFLVGLNDTGLWRISIRSYAEDTVEVDTPNNICSETGVGVTSLDFVGNWASGTAYFTTTDDKVMSATAVNGSNVTATAATNVTGVYPLVAATDSKVVVLTSSKSLGDGGYDNDGAFNVSVDGGATFVQTNLIQADCNIDTITFADPNTIFIVADGNSVYKTTDAGVSWQRIVYSKSWTYDKVYVSPTFATDNTLYLTTDGRNLAWKSTDGGKTLAPYVVASAIVDMAVVDANTYYYVGDNGNVYKSTNLFAALTGVNGAYSLCYVDAANIYVGTNDGKVFKSTDGATFAEVGTESAFDSGDVVVAVAADGTVYAASSTGGAGVKMYTTNGWAPVGEVNDGAQGTLPASVEIYDLAVNADGTIYIVANSGMIGASNVIYRNADGTWYEDMKYGRSTLAANPFDATIFGNTIYAVGEINDPVLGWISYMANFTDTLSAAPVFTSPGEGAELLDMGIATLAWNAVPGATEYTWRISTTADMVSGEMIPSVSTTMTTSVFLPNAGVTLVNGQTYYVTVQVTAPYHSKVSPVTKFMTKLTTLGSNLTLNAPAAGANISATNPTFSWAAVANAVSYEFKLSDKPDFSTTVDSVTGLNSTVYTTGVNLEVGKTYYWQVRAVNGDIVSDWAQSTFTVTAAAGEPGGPVITVVPPAVTVEPPDVIVTVPPQEPASTFTPAWVWVIIAIGAILVIAVIVLIARTRRV